MKQQQKQEYFIITQLRVGRIIMIDNFFEQDSGSEYHSYDQVFSHQSGYSIYLGDASSANNLQFINSCGIGLVVSAAINMEHLNYDHNERKIKHLIYSLLDSKTQNMSKYFTEFYELIQSEIMKANVLVHCFAGISRSATLVISYVMRKKNINFKQAIAEIRKFRPTVLPNLGFERQLKQYEKILKLQQLTITRKLISKTSQSRKHQSKKLPQIGLPEIFALGKTIVRPKVYQLQPPPLLVPSSQMEPRKLRLGNLELIRQFTADQRGQKQYKQPLSTRIPLKSFRKRSISINKNGHKNLRGSQQQVQLVRLPPHKLAINDIKFGTDKVIKSLAIRDLYQ